MVESPLELVARHPSWRGVLEAYHAAERELRSTDGPPVRWIPRLRAMDGIDAPELSQTHGRLIAYGLLRFQLVGAGIAAGLEYQLSPLGRQALGEAEAPADDDAPAERDAA